MNKIELQAAVAEHNRILRMIEEQFKFSAQGGESWALSDMGQAITDSFFDAYADDLANFPDIVDTINKFQAGAVE